MFDLVGEMRTLNTTMQMIAKTLKLILKELGKTAPVESGFVANIDEDGLKKFVLEREEEQHSDQKEVNKK